jgi:hypothetical protein
VLAAEVINPAPNHDLVGVAQLPICHHVCGLGFLSSIIFGSGTKAARSMKQRIWCIDHAQECVTGNELVMQEQQCSCCICLQPVLSGGHTSTGSAGGAAEQSRGLAVDWTHIPTDIISAALPLAAILLSFCCLAAASVPALKGHHMGGGLTDIPFVILYIIPTECDSARQMQCTRTTFKQGQQVAVARCCESSRKPYAVSEWLAMVGQTLLVGFQLKYCVEQHSK